MVVTIRDVSMNHANLLFRTVLLYHLHEYQMNEVTQINVLVKDYYFSIRDNGRGMGAERLINGSPYIELNLTQIQCPFQGQSETNILLHGLGIAVVNNFASQLIITSYRNQKIYRQVFENAHSLNPIDLIGNTDKSGTLIEVKLNPDLVLEPLNVPEILNFIEEIKMKCSGLTLNFNH